jgi:two-component system response regulator
MKNSNLVLLVEDNPDDELLTIMAIEKNNLTIQIKIVRDGAEALDFLFGTGEYASRDLKIMPTIILLDLKLPKINGLDVLKKIRENPKTSLLPVVVLTSSKQDQDIIESYKLGVNSYIRKPVDFSQFTKTVNNIGMYWLLLNESPPNFIKE